MNHYANILKKMKALLKEDDDLTKEQCEVHQWQLLAKIANYTFVVGKGGVNTIFYTRSSVDRVVCYPDEMLEILEELSKSRIFTYVALDKKKKVLGNSIDPQLARGFKNARYLLSIDHKGRSKVIDKKTVDLFGKRSWRS